MLSRKIEGDTAIARAFRELRDKMPITIQELAEERGVQENEDGQVTGGEYERVGLAILGSCEICAASIACYNAYPSRSGYWRCGDCIMDDGWGSVEEANKDIFGSEDDN